MKSLNNIFDLTGKVAVVTGGARGIGESIAYGLKEAGAKVYIHGSNFERTKKVAEENGYGFSVSDLSKKEGYQKLIEDISSKETKVDILVNNAGVEYHLPLENATDEYLDDMYNVNLKAPYFIVQGLLPLLKKSKSASVINVTSIHETVPVRNNSSYCMSKASLAMYTKVSALELARYNIRVNNLAPGAIETDLNRDLLKEMDFSQWIPLKRVGECADLIGPIVFLASEASSYVTGTTLFVDGGYKENLLRY